MWNFHWNQRGICSHFTGMMTSFIQRRYFVANEVDNDVQRSRKWRGDFLFFNIVVLVHFQISWVKFFSLAVTPQPLVIRRELIYHFYQKHNSFFSILASAVVLRFFVKTKHFCRNQMQESNKSCQLAGIRIYWISYSKVCNQT